MRGWLGLAFVCLLSLLSTPLRAAEFDFDPGEFEKKPFEWGGYLELKGERFRLDQDAALARLNFFREPRSSLNRFAPTLQLDGSLRRGVATLNWKARATASQDELAWSDHADLYEGYVSIKAAPGMTFDLGKKVFKWGKGYAWSPVGFIDRPKDPDDPEEAMEGFIGAGFDLVRSFSGPLKTLGLTTVALPVRQGVNEDFGEGDNLNLAAKLYLLLYDTDIDLLAYTGNSRSSRFGLDFSKNLAANFEIHGELAHIPRQQVKGLAADGSTVSRTLADTSYLLGLRYLSENEITTIVEYYHNDDGYSEEELHRFYQMIDTGYRQFVESGATGLLSRAKTLSQLYGRPQVGRDYLYLKLSIKEPFDLLYFSPGLTAIVNLDDRGCSIGPEAVYTGFTNWELRLRWTLIKGRDLSEYGEKQNSSKTELRLRWFF